MSTDRNQAGTVDHTMIDVDRNSDILRLTLDRPKSANALHPDAVEVLLAELADLDGAKMISLRGNGRHFCAGFDLSDLQDLSDGDLLWRFVRIEGLLQEVFHAPVPVVSFGHGKVMGAGTDLFAVAGHRIAAPGTSFRMPGWNFGLALGTRRLTRLIGPDNARDVLINSRTIDTETALELGLVTEILEQDRWDQRETELREEFGALEPTALSHLLDLTKTDTRSEDLAALVTSATQPGLRDRILTFRENALK